MLPQNARKRTADSRKIKPKEVSEMAENGYTGKIGNAGTQVVNTPNKPQAAHKAPVVHRGGDLRVKKGNQ